MLNHEPEYREQTVRPLESGRLCLHARRSPASQLVAASKLHQ